MKIRTGDNVKVLSGKNRGKTGKVTQVLTKPSTGDMLVVVEGVNVRKKHIRPRQSSQKGQTIELAYPMHASKVMLLDPSTHQPTRVGYTRDGETKKRVAKRTGNVL